MVRHAGSMSDDIVMLRDAILTLEVVKDWPRANLLALQLIHELSKKGYEVAPRQDLP